MARGWGESDQGGRRALAAEEGLEDFAENRVDILGLGDLLVIGRQVITAFGKRIDMLTIDAQGDP